jgi:iron complex outermembrane receptor protein
VRRTWPGWLAVALGLIAVATAGRAGARQRGDGEGDGDEPVRLGTIAVEAERDPAAKSSADADRAARRRADLEEVPFVTIIDATAPSARASSVAELVERQAGIQIRSRGGLGAFTAVSLRGSEANEVAVFLDGVPLNRAASGVIDLAQLPADGLERVEIYRGVPPVGFGGEVIGGAIHLVSRRGARRPQLRISTGGGSFGARAASLGYGDTRGGLATDVTVAYRGATGDFTYYDNAGTLFDRSDDAFATRQNNGFDQLSLAASVGTARPKRGRIGWRLGANGLWKRQGVPGIGSVGAEALSSRLDTARLVLEGELVRRGRWADLTLAAHLVGERLAFDNPRGEKVGPYGAAHTENASVGAGLNARVDVPLRTIALLSLLADVRVEERTPRDLLVPARDGLPSVRALGGVAASVELRLLRERLVLTPAVRLDGVVSTLVTDESGARVPGATDSSVFASPRLGVRARVASWLTLRGSAGRFVRFPTLLEQFGDGGFVIGTRALRPETAWGGDAGFSATAPFPRGRGRFALEGALFGREVADLITFLPSANAFAAANIGPVRILGVESRLTLRALDLVQLTVDYTFLSSENFSSEPGARGKPLPYRPRHQLFGRLDVGWRALTAFYEVDWVDESTRDAQSYNRIPGRVLHALGARLSAGAWDVSVEVRNLADLRVVPLPLGGSARAGETTPYPLVDFYDYPLPGRAIYATVRYAPELTRPKEDHR